LPSLRVRAGETHAAHDVVQPALEHHDQVRARRAFHPHGPLEIAAELPLEQSVGALHLLLLAQLHAIADHLRAASLAVLTRHEIALFDRALFGKAPKPLQKELHAFPPAKPANAFSMSCQVLSPLPPQPGANGAPSEFSLYAAALRRSAPIVRHRRHVLDRVNVQAR